MDELTQEQLEKIVIYLYGAAVGMIALRVGQKVYEVLERPYKKLQEERERNFMHENLEFMFRMGKVFGRAEVASEAKKSSSED